MDYQSLFTAFQYKGLNLKNRIVMPAMTRRYSPHGIPTAEVIDYYRRRAKDIGLILSEGTVIDRPASKNSRDIPNFYGEALPQWQKVLNSVHQNDGKMGPQLWHVGIAQPDATGWVPSSPMERPQTMGLQDINDTIEAFAKAALEAKKIGFDCLEIHAAHGYLIDQFFWQQTNTRQDDYGGDTIAKRSKFAIEVIKAIRKSVGPEFVIILRLSQWKVQDYGARLATTPNEMSSWLDPLAEAGVDIFHCSQRKYWEPEFEKSDLNFAGWAKKITGQPTITVGSVGLSGDFLGALYNREGSEKSNFLELTRRLDRGDFDLVAVGRAILQDPFWVSKVKQGKFDELKDFSKNSLSVLY